MNGKKVQRRLRHFHKYAIVVWIFLIVPTLLWWKDSVLWIAVMSIWANVMGHFSAYQGARAEKKAEESNGSG